MVKKSLEDNSIDELRSIFQREKNTTVVMSCVFCIIVIFIISLFLFSSSLYNNDNYANVSSNGTLPCLGNERQAVPNNTIGVRVLNGTDLQGYAYAVSKALENREFLVYPADSYDVIEDTEIHFGANAILQAYILADNFNSAKLVLDDRKDGLIDIIIGKNFQELKDKYLVSSSTKNYVFANVDKCIEIDDITPKKAIEHDITLMKSYNPNDEIITPDHDQNTPTDDAGNPLENEQTVTESDESTSPPE